MVKKTIIVNVENVTTVSTSYEGDELIVSIDGKVLTGAQFATLYEALSTVHSFHDMWQFNDNTNLDSPSVAVNVG